MKLTAGVLIGWTGGLGMTLFAEAADTSAPLAGLIGAVAGAVAVIGTWVLTALKERSAARRQEKADDDSAERTRRADAISEWQNLLKQRDSELKDIKDHVARQDTEIINLIRSEGVCREEVATLKGVNQMLNADVRRLQVLTKDSHPGVTGPVSITASAEDGIIRVASPGVGPLLAWLPFELIGQNVEVLIPEDLRGRHRVGIAEVRAGRKRVDPSKTIYTEALKKTGERVPIAVNLTQWTSPKGSMFLNAEIRDVMRVPLPVPPPSSGEIELHGPKEPKVSHDRP